MTSSAATSSWRYPRATSGSPAIRRTRCGLEWGGEAHRRLIALEARRDWAYESAASSAAGDSVSNSESENKQRNRKIAHNEANRVAVSGVRVSTWAIAAAVIIALIVLGIAWPWLNR